MVKHKKKHKHASQHKHEKAESKKRPKSHIVLWIAAAALLLVIVGAAYDYMKPESDTEPVIELSPVDEPVRSVSMDAVKLDFYVMSQCPYGLQVENSIAPVLEKLGADIDFNLNFIANENADGTFRSLHGQPEVDGNIAQLCASKYDPDKYMDMVVCQNQNSKAIPGNWEQCATDNGLEVEKIRTCYEGDEGADLLRASIAETNKVKATGSPTIYINDVKYAGARGENDFLRAICNEYESDRPAACDDIPEPVKVNVLILNDKRCAECDTSRLVGQLKGYFPGLDVIAYDYSDAKGKEMYDTYGLKALPAMLFDDSMLEAENYAQVQRYLEQVDDKYTLRVGAQFDPTAEICDNNKDDTGNGMVDCDDETCKDTMECREEIEQHLQVFVMSDCPYGTRALKVLKEIADNFGDNLDFEVHYIANEAGNGFTSLHGQYEVDENIIQLCVFEHSPDAWLDYVYCRSDKGVKGIDWTECADETGVDKDAVQECFDSGAGADLLREDIKIANGLKIGASPTWLANNRYQFGGIDAEAVKTQFCTYNSGTTGCENTLSGQAAAPSGSCG